MDTTDSIWEDDIHLAQVTRQLCEARWQQRGVTDPSARAAWVLHGHKGIFTLIPYCDAEYASFRDDPDDPDDFSDE